MIALSTAWNYKSDGDPRQMLLEIKEAGVDAVELSYRVTGVDLKKIKPLLKEFGIKVASLHNFCPVPSDEGSLRHPSNHYRLSSQDEDERRKAVYWTKNTIDTAVGCGAGVVVIHAGTVEVEGDPTRKLLDMYRVGQDGTEEFKDLRRRLLDLRKSRRGPFLEAVERSLSEVLPYAMEKKVTIGLETRYYPVEIPNHEEIGLLLNRFSQQGLLYWHDTGHAEVNSRLGITPHEDYLKDYGHNLAGWHLHGVRSLRDHLAPFDGDFDIRAVFPFMNDRQVKIIESHTSASAGQIKEAVGKLP